jgi:hypothetical protein
MLLLFEARVVARDALTEEIGFHYFRVKMIWIVIPWKLQPRNCTLTFAEVFALLVLAVFQSAKRTKATPLRKVRVKAHFVSWVLGMFPIVARRRHYQIPAHQGERGGVTKVHCRGAYGLSGDIVPIVVPERVSQLQKTTCGGHRQVCDDEAYGL